MHAVDSAEHAVEVIDKRVNKGVLMRTGRCASRRAEGAYLRRPDIEAFGDC
jgi:hypothetical protein